MGDTIATTYGELCDEISVLEDRARDLDYQFKRAYQACYNGDYEKIKLPLDRAVIEYDNVKEKYIEVMDLLEHKKATIIEMDRKLSLMNGILYQVAYRRDVLQQSLTIIAEDLGYSYPYVRKLSMKAKRIKGTKKEQTA